MSFVTIGEWTFDIKRLVAFQMVPSGQLRPGIKKKQESTGQVMNTKSDYTLVARLIFDGMTKDIVLDLDQTAGFLLYMEDSFPPRVIAPVHLQAGPGPA